MWSIHESFRGEVLTMGRYTNLRTFTFIRCAGSFLWFKISLFCFYLQSIIWANTAISRHSTRVASTCQVTWSWWRQRGTDVWSSAGVWRKTTAVWGVLPTSCRSSIVNVLVVPRVVLPFQTLPCTMFTPVPENSCPTWRPVILVSQVSVRT